MPWDLKTMFKALILISLSFGGCMVGLKISKLDDFASESAKRVGLLETELSQLRSEVTFAERRRHNILVMTHIIRRENATLRPEVAYFYAESIQTMGEKYAFLDPFFILAVMRQESAFNKDAVSSAGARGLMQIMPATGRVISRVKGVTFRVDILFDPKTNIEFGAFWLNMLMEQWVDLLGADDERILRAVLAEYNGGPRAASRLVTDGATGFRETDHFVPAVLAFYEAFRNTRVEDFLEISRQETPTQ